MVKMELEDSQSEINETDPSFPTPEPSSSSKLNTTKKVGYTNCKVCHQRIASFRLQPHFKSFHDLTTVSNQDQIHKCPTDGCGAYFLRKYQLRLHNLQSHVNKKLRSALSSELIDGVRYFKCKLCNTPFEKLRRLRRHLTTSACGKGNYNATAVECPECKETFERKEQLWEHQSQVHSNDKKIVCTKCGKWFIKNHNLQVHLEYHKGPAMWKWKCGECGKKCATEQQLNRHLNSHKTKRETLKKDSVAKQATRTIAKNGPTLSCQFCGKTFGKVRNLRRHCKSQHSNEIEAVTQAASDEDQDTDNFDPNSMIVYVQSL